MKIESFSSTCPVLQEVLLIDTIRGSDLDFNHKQLQCKTEILTLCFR